MSSGQAQLARSATQSGNDEGGAGNARHGGLAAANRISVEVEAKLARLLQNQVFQTHYAKLFKACFNNLLEDEPNYTGLTQLEGVVGEVEKGEEALTEAFNVSVLTATDFLRKNFVESEIRYTLSELGFKNEIVESFTAAYTKFVEFIRNRDNEGISEKFDSAIQFSKLVDVQWKQDFVVATKYITYLNKDQYYINLKTLDNEKFRTINFCCSLEQLTEFVHKLGVALKNIEGSQI